MDCRQNYVNQIIEDIKKIIGTERTSATYLSGNRILLPISKDNPSLLTKENTVEWAKSLQRHINTKYQSKIYGNIININPNKYEHGTEITYDIPSKLIDAYVRMNEPDQLPAAKKVLRHQGEVDKLKDRVTTLKRALAANKSDRERVADLQSKIDILESRIEILETEDRLIDVINYGNEDMREVTRILTKNTVSETELFYANKLIKQWENSLGELFSHNDLTKVDGKFSPNVQAVQDIITQAQALRQTYTSVFENAVLEMFKKYGVEATPEQIFGAKREIGALSANLMDISRTDDIIFQTVSKIIKDAATDTEREVISTVKEVDTLFDSVKKDTTFKAKGFDVFIQEVDGKKTGNLVARFSQKFYDTVKQLRSAAKKTKDPKAWENYFKWKRDNMILFDLRKLFNEEYNELDGTTKYNQSEIDAHIEDLKKQLGERGYAEFYERLREKFELYKDDLEANKQRIDSLEGDDVEKASMLQEWVLSNSPFVYADSVYDGKKNKIGSKFINPRGYKYTYEVPRKYTSGLKKTDWYDEKFETLEKSDALYNFYKYTISKYNELYNYLPDYAVEDLQYNYLPEIRKNIAELFSDKGMKGGMTGWYDKVISELTTSEMSDISYAERDPDTGKPLKTLPITMVGAKLSSEEKSYDIVKITKAFALMSLSYKHKSKIEDSIRIAQQLVANSKEMQVNAEGKQLVDALGRPMATKEGLKNYKAQFEYAIESMVYGERRVEEGISNKRLLTSEEKETKKTLEKQLEDPNLDEETKNVIKAQIEGLGSNIVGSKAWDKVLQFAQLKGMAWNLFAPANNMVFGFVSNLIHASGGEDFNINDFFNAKAIMLNSIGKSITLDTIESKTAKKINKLMELYNVVGEIDQMGYKSTAFESSAAKGLKKLAPYELTRRAEYLNQGTTFVSLMLGTKVGDKTLWEMYDENGELKDGMEFDLTEQKKFKNKLEQIKKSIHGNYDPNSAVKIKKTTLGRAVMMFRSWVAEGFATRFETEKDDILLGRKRKGRYRTYGDLGLTKSTQLLLSQMANFLTFGGAFKTSLDQLSDVDKANMRKNSAEILIYISLYTLALMLKSIDSDDDDEKKAINALLNVSFRVQNDMAFFTSPLAFEKITQSSIPAMSIITDAAKFIKAAEETIAGNGEYTRGTYKGQSKIKVALAKQFPGLTQIPRTISGLETVDNR